MSEVPVDVIVEDAFAWVTPTPVLGVANVVTTARIVCCC